MFSGTKGMMHTTHTLIEWCNNLVLLQHKRRPALIYSSNRSPLLRAYQFEV
jgi:hypothetical protein